MLYLQSVSLDRNVVARSIYGTYRHEVIDTGVVMETSVKAELQEFLTQYVSFLGCGDAKCFRIDLYFDHENVYVIEVNVEVADGWGVALNLSRAIGDCVQIPGMLPSVFPTFPDDPRQTEFALALHELARLGHDAQTIDAGERMLDPLDDKMLLARFSSQWEGSRVQIPMYYTWETHRWDEVPMDVYLKRVMPSNKKSNDVVLRADKSPSFMKWAYKRKQVVAQQRIRPYLTSEQEPVQVVLMCAGTHVVAGYAQVASPGRSIINDKGTRKGPLLFL